jgi:hypothetical protein
MQDFEGTSETTAPIETTALIAADSLLPAGKVAGRKFFFRAAVPFL